MDNQIYKEEEMTPDQKQNTDKHNLLKQKLRVIQQVPTPEQIPCLLS